jgi:hypothetical protein
VAQTWPRQGSVLLAFAFKLLCCKMKFENVGSVPTCWAEATWLCTSIDWSAINCKGLSASYSVSEPKLKHVLEKA